MPLPLHILVLCTGNSARSILGEALLNHHGTARQGGQVTAVSAGSRPTGTPNPFALSLLSEKGIDTGFARSKSWDEFSGEGARPIDLAITVCDSAAAEECPYFAGAPVRVHWGLPDPAAVTGSDAEKAAAFATTWASLEARVLAMMALPLETLSPAELKAALDQIAAEAEAQETSQ